MSRKNLGKKQNATKRKSKTSAKKQSKVFSMQRNVTIVALLILLVVYSITRSYKRMVLM